MSKELCIMAACANCGRDHFEVLDLDALLRDSDGQPEIVVIHCEQCKAENRNALGGLYLPGAALPVFWANQDMDDEDGQAGENETFDRR